MDMINELGELAFASRLKRLSERLLKDVSRIYSDLNVDFEARWFSIFHTLARHAPMPVTALAHAVGLTHTAVNQVAAEMTEKKLVLSAKDRSDERRRLLRLSKKGRAVAAALEPAWREIRESTRELIAASGRDVLQGIGRIEELLDERDMYERVCARLKIEPVRDVEIVDYRPAYKKHFRSLNSQWLKELFVVEKYDEALLSDPNGRIVRKGGAVLFARMEGGIVGACALVNHGGGVFELTKMAVAPHARGRKIGMRLARAVIDRAAELGATTVFLETSPRLTAAIRLYEKLGFTKTARSPLGPSRYKRRTFAMQLELGSD